MDVLTNWNVVLDVAIILLPLLVVLYLIIRFIVPKKPALGIGLAIGGGLLGAFLIRSRLKKAFDVEKKIAEHNEMMAKFKAKQKQRAQAVLANKQVIDVLEKQRKKLAKNAQKHETQLKLLDAELTDRKKLNEKILSESEEFLQSVEGRSAKRQALLRQYEHSVAGEAQPEPENRGTAETPDIVLNGYRLLEG